MKRTIDHKWGRLKALIGPALKISWGPPTANIWPDWSPEKRVNRDKLDQ